MAQRTEVVGEHVTGKSLDDRVCLFAMLPAARRIEDPEATIHFAATVQEEVGLRGARALGVDLDPDLAIALDVTVANDIPGFEAGEQVTELGEGTAIKLKDARSSPIRRSIAGSATSPRNGRFPTSSRCSRAAGRTRPGSRTPTAPGPSAPSRSRRATSTPSPRAPTTRMSPRPSTS
jgi:hypothetical protein